MIIVLSPGDADLIASARRQSFNETGIYGETFVVWTTGVAGNKVTHFLDSHDVEVPAPQLGAREKLFVSGHGVAEGGTGVAEIGDAEGGYAMDGIEFHQNVFDKIRPAIYEEDIYVDACSSANWGEDNFSFIEVLKTQVDVSPGCDSDVFGRWGDVGYEIPHPDAPGAWDVPVA